MKKCTYKNLTRLLRNHWR